MSTTRICTLCKGTGITKYETMPEIPERPCYACEGTKEFSEPSLPEIYPFIRNAKSGKLYSTSMHTKAGRERSKHIDPITRRRAQYIWRMARWHAGADSSGFNLGGAVMADMEIHGDPWRLELDKMADQVADDCYGKGANLRAARRWSFALHGR
jgi:hypothetical protein